jgi:two-component system, response regulator PdtaR
LSQSEKPRNVVLVVEDEPLIRWCAIEMIEEVGYVVLEAVDADAAIAILKARDDICIIFTDIDMPGSMDGLKLARAVRDGWPPIKIIVTSGHRTPGAGDLPDGGRFLPKPYRADDLAAALSALAA